ncbi:MAG: outer membrane beta-barrel protein [Bacteroidales bacterium]|nr:outer membrane beta-barrel protein [Bacteroidales bacterium]
MKKLIVALVAIFAFSASAIAQSAGDFSLGLRLGDSWHTGRYNGNTYSDWGFNAELSAVYFLSDANRIEAELGWSDYSGRAYGYNYTNGYLHAAASYQWYWNIIAGLGWFVGPAANLGVWIYDAHYSGTGYHTSDAAFILGLGAQAGIEYDFDFPLQLALDTRPCLNFGIPGDLTGGVFFWPSWFNFSIRYRF